MGAIGSTSSVSAVQSTASPRKSVKNVTAGAEEAVERESRFDRSSINAFSEPAEKINSAEEAKAAANAVAKSIYSNSENAAAIHNADVKLMNVMAQ